MAVILNNADHKEWTEWDFKLFKAHYILEDWYRDGIPIWVDESDRVTFDAIPRVSKSRAAVERASEKEAKKKTKSHGVYYIVEPRVMDGGELPTREEWLQEQGQKKQEPQRRPPPKEPHILQGKNRQ